MKKKYSGHTTLTAVNKIIANPFFSLKIASDKIAVVSIMYTYTPAKKKIIAAMQ